MQFSVLQQNLQQSLKTVQKAVPIKAQLPILSSILITAKDSTITLSATDLYMGLQAQLAATIQEEGSIAVPGKIFAEAIATMNSGSITIEVKESTMYISSDSGTKFTVPVQSGEEYPEFPEVTGKTHQLDSATLKKIDSFVGFSAATDQARLILTTILLQPSDKTASDDADMQEQIDLSKATEAVATDGFRLAVLKVPELQDLEKPILFPAKAIQEVARLAEQLNENTVALSISDTLKQVFFSIGNINMYARLVEGDFPPYERIMPSLFLAEGTVDGVQLLQQLKQASIFARDISNIVQVTLNPLDGEMLLEAKGAMGSFSSKLPMTFAKQELAEPTVTIAFNIKYVLDFLTAQKPEQVWFGMSESLKPALFKIVGNEAYKYVVMPFRVNS